MFPVSNSIPGMPRVKFPNVCTKQPLGRSAFCKEHHAVALSKNVPTELRKFVQQYEITGTHVLSTQFVVSRKHSTLTIFPKQKRMEIRRA